MKKLIMLFIFILMFSAYNHGSEYKNENDKNKLTLENVYYELLKKGIKEPLIVLAQIYHETANLKSKVCLTRNNLLGFNSNKGYQKFASWQDCIIYAKNWQDKRYKGGNYFKFLKEIKYATNVNYTKKIKVTLAKIITTDFLKKESCNQDSIN